MKVRSVILIDDARTAILDQVELDPADVVGGSPRTSITPLLTTDGLEIGIWEITSGIVVDTEVDEVFIVLAGRARVDLADGESLLIGAGAVVRLAAGDRTTWIVYETLRKIYIMLPGQTTKNDAS